MSKFKVNLGVICVQGLKRQMCLAIFYNSFKWDRIQLTLKKGWRETWKMRNVLYPAKKSFCKLHVELRRLLPR